MYQWGHFFFFTRPSTGGHCNGMKTLTFTGDYRLFEPIGQILGCIPDACARAEK